jgi:hypothetical protein
MLSNAFQCFFMVFGCYKKPMPTQEKDSMRLSFRQLINAMTEQVRQVVIAARNEITNW